MSSRVAVRIAALALVVGVVWYITHLNAEIARMRAAAPGTPAAAPAAAPAPAAPPAAPAAPRVVTAEQRQAMLERLNAASGSPVWFATVGNNPEAAAFQKTLQSIFEEAKWEVKGNKTMGFAMKPGVFVFAGEEESPEYLSAVHDAFEAAGITVVSGRGYNEFVRSKKADNPDWVGIELGPDEAYVIAIGRAG